MKSEDQPLWDNRFPCDNQLCRTSFGKLHGLIDQQKLEIIELKGDVRRYERLLKIFSGNIDICGDISALKGRISRLEMAVFPATKAQQEFMDGCDAEMGKSRKNAK